MNETIIGVIIGGVIGTLGGTINHLIQIKSERKKHILEKKEETYLNAINIVTRYHAEIPKSQSHEKTFVPNELLIEFNNIKPSMTLYGTEEIYEYFKDTVIKIISSKKAKNKNDDEVFNMTKQLNQMILKDLN